jgi:hypothetical protein
MRALLRPLLSAAGVGDRGHEGDQGGDGHGEQSAGPKVYMHPKTYNIYCESEQMTLAYLCLHTETLSNDDSNEVHYKLVPIPFGAQGDGNVVAMSANPQASRLSHPFDTTRSFPSLPYWRMCASRDVASFIKGRIDGLVQDFCTE